MIKLSPWSRRDGVCQLCFVYRRLFPWSNICSVNEQDPFVLLDDDQAESHHIHPEWHQYPFSKLAELSIPFS